MKITLKVISLQNRQKHPKFYYESAQFQFIVAKGFHGCKSHLVAGIVLFILVDR